MNQLITEGIVLNRTNYGEADRILTMLTPDYGKLSLMARGVRKVKSRLAGGIELFSVSEISFIRGRGEIATLISSRLGQHYAQIVHDITRTMFGYNLLKRLNRVTEDAAGEEYFALLKKSLTALDNLELPLELIELWFAMQLLKVTGHAPNLHTTLDGHALQQGETYSFDIEAMVFSLNSNGSYAANTIKLLRLAVATAAPAVLAKVEDATTAQAQSLQLAKAMLAQHLRI